MEELIEIDMIASVIQLAVAPVFLLAGIAGLLNVLSVRLGRAVDRVRVVETRLGKEPHSDHVNILQAEISALWSRIRLANWSIRMFVAGALMVCLVIVSLFFSELTHFNMSSTIVVFFLGTMLLLILGLILFLIEVSISTRSIGHGITEILDEEKNSED
jgi:drug/metabolite transporter (DMT)-like permease